MIDNGNESPILAFLREILTFIGAFAIPLFGYLGVRYKKDADTKAKIDQEIKDRRERFLHSKVQEQIQHNSKLLRTVAQLNKETTYLFAETKAERFLILMAVNGKNDYNTVSAVYQRQRGDLMQHDAVKRYNNLRIDQEYKQMLSEAYRESVVDIHTARMPKSMLKSIYENEGVTHSRVYYLHRIPIDDKGHDVLIYCSVATYHKEGFTDRGRALIDISIMANIKPLTQKMIESS